jgi:excisionase family DNA binding protein
LSSATKACKPVLERLAFSPAETGQVLGISEATVRRAIETGQIYARRLGRKWLIPVTETKRLLEVPPAA